MDGTDAPKKAGTYRRLTFNKPTRRCTYIIAAVTVLCLILCIVLAVTLSGKSKDDCPPGLHCDWRSVPSSQFLKDERCDEVCTTYPCIKTAHHALSRIDSNKDPCEDFYGFACGTYEKKSMVFSEDSEGVYTYREMANELVLNVKEVIDSISEKPGRKGLSLRLAKRIYDDCMDTDHHWDALTKDIWKKVFSEDGMLPWPLIDKNAQSNQDHLAKMMSTSLFFEVNPFFWMTPPSMETVNNRQTWTIRFWERGPHELPSVHKEANTDDPKRTFSRYRYVISEILSEIGVDEGDVETIVTSFMELEKSFFEAATKAKESSAKIYEKNGDLRHEIRNYTCGDLNNRMNRIQWCRIAPQLLTDYGFPLNTSITIQLPAVTDHFEEVNKLFGHFLDRDIINYIALKFMMGHLKYMPSGLSELYYNEIDLFTEQHGYEAPSATRWQQCVDVVLDLLAIPIEREYLKQKVDEETRAKVTYMVKKSKETFSSLIGKISWFSLPVPEKQQKDEIEKMKLYLGSMDKFLSDDGSTMDRYLENVASSTVLRNTKSPLVTYMLELKKAILRAPPNDLDIFEGRGTLSIFNPFIGTQSIDIPYGMLLFPMLLPGRPMYAEYAGLGSHIFKHMAISLFMGLYDKRNSTEHEVLLRTSSCLREQLHLYNPEKIKFKVENMEEEAKDLFDLFQVFATLGSFQAYKDYLKENNEEKGLPGLPFTNEQLFFISSAQIHCEKFTEKGYANFPIYLMSPARFRVNVPFANLKEFSDAFRCPSDSPMNPKKKCCLLGDGKLSHEC